MELSPAPLPGSGALAFARAGRRTLVQRCLARSPLKLLHPRNHGPAAWVYSSHHGGGLVGGDRVRLEVRVGPDASALLMTQSSTKVYRSERGSGQFLRADVERGGLLVATPDPVVCFAGSSFQQEQEFHLAPNANLAVVDWMSCGRRASGERWAFRRYRSRLRIWRQGRLLLHEALLLDPADGALEARWGRFNVWAVAAVCGPRLAEDASQLLQEVSALPLKRRAEWVLSASPLGDQGVLLRLAGVSVEQIGLVWRAKLAFLGPLLGDDPWARKW